MKKIKQTPPIFKVGETVWSKTADEWQELSITKTWWNGLCNMYSFEDTDMSCGELYITRTRLYTEAEVQERIEGALARYKYECNTTI